MVLRLVVLGQYSVSTNVETPRSDWTRRRSYRAVACGKLAFGVSRNAVGRIFRPSRPSRTRSFVAAAIFRAGGEAILRDSRGDRNRAGGLRVCLSGRASNLWRVFR